MLYPLATTQFRLLKIGMVRPACPHEVTRIPSNLAANAAIVVTANKAKFGAVNSIGFEPDAVFAGGVRRRADALASGVTKTWAFVQASLDIKADDEISCEELSSKLYDSLKLRLYGSSKDTSSNQMWAGIVQVYPFENYMIYSTRGELYRQGYTLDPVRRDVALTGGSTKVLQQYADADKAEARLGVAASGRPGVLQVKDGVISACIERMVRVQTGARYSYATMPGNDQTVSYGNKTSELVTQVIRNFANINEAANAYVAYAKANGIAALKPSWSPVLLPVYPNVSRGATTKDFGPALLARGIDPFQFALWGMRSSIKKTKLVGGKQLGVAAFAYAGSPTDTTTWFYPIDNKANVAASLALVRSGSMTRLAVAKKDEVMGKIQAAAESYGLDTGVVAARKTPYDPLACLRRW